MKEQITSLIKQLASQLGTTTEYLWRILVAQGPVSATNSLIIILLTLFFGWVLWKIHSRLLKTNAAGDSYYEVYEEGVVVPMIFGGLILLILIIYSLSSIPNVINGYFNPEYWALNHVLCLIGNN